MLHSHSRQHPHRFAGPARLLAAGFNALAAGDTRRASACCQRLLQQQPGLAQGHFLVGLVALASGERKTAINAFGSVTEIDPGHGAAWAQLARLFVQSGQIVRAEQAVRRAGACCPDDAVVQDLIGTVFLRIGDQAQARNWHEMAYRNDPRNPGYAINHANGLIFNGQTTGAIAHLQRLL